MLTGSEFILFCVVVETMSYFILVLIYFILVLCLLVEEDSNLGGVNARFGVCKLNVNVKFRVTRVSVYESLCGSLISIDWIYTIRKPLVY
jgi:hypothetical protein